MHITNPLLVMLHNCICRTWQTMSAFKLGVGWGASTCLCLHHFKSIKSSWKTNNTEETKHNRKHNNNSYSRLRPRSTSCSFFFRVRNSSQQICSFFLPLEQEKSTSQHPPAQPVNTSQLNQPTLASQLNQPTLASQLNQQTLVSQLNQSTLVSKIYLKQSPVASETHLSRSTLTN